MLVNKDTIDINGTFLQGDIKCSFTNLCRVFGPPIKSYESKSQVEWHIQLDNGDVATIYDWKQYGVPYASINNWNIGGHKQEVVNIIKDVINNHGR